MQKTLFILILFLAEIAFAQERNPTVWPYGGVPDSSRYKEDMKKAPLNFTKAYFKGAHFDGLTYFRYAQFDSAIDFSEAKFNHMADFGGAQFNSGVSFRSAQFKSLARFLGAKFNGQAFFSDAKFNGHISFYNVQFSNLADFERVQFKHRTDFKVAKFNFRADFTGAQFDSVAFFTIANFNNDAIFLGTMFNGPARFEETKFDSVALFMLAQFDTLAIFRGAQFDTLANFKITKFDNVVDFSGAYFDDMAYFENTKFNGMAIFSDAKFNGPVYFWHAQFDTLVYFGDATVNNRIDFRGTNFNNSSHVDFSFASIQDTVIIGYAGLPYIQRYNFLRARLLLPGKQIVPVDAEMEAIEKTIAYPGARILLCGPVDIQIQLEKFRFLSLNDTLNYYDKKDIISTLKDSTFKGETYKKEHFELDYIFAKSTMYQKESVDFEKYSAFHPISWGQFLYNVTMGLGYRPFRLAWWILGFIVLFAITYYFWIPQQICRYIFKDEKEKSRQRGTIRLKQNLNFTDRIIYCLYFSSMLFFTFRLKKDILTFFDTKQKRAIVFEYLIGLSIYIAFLTLSKAGSILHNLKSLFVG